MLHGTNPEMNVTTDELNLFVKALDNNLSGKIEFNNLLHFMLKGLAQSEEKRQEFAGRSAFHGKLNRFMLYVLDKERE